MRTEFLSGSIFNTFDFNFNTSSGDHISLSMYDRKSIEHGRVETDSISAGVMSLRHEYGYEFKYSGDGLSDQDMKEINEALKSISPSIDDFIKGVKIGAVSGSERMNNLASSIKSALPIPRDTNHKNAIMSHTLDLFDSLISKNRPNYNVLERTNELFRRLHDMQSRFSFYA